MSKRSTNASDPRQVRAGERIERRREQRWEDSLRATMATPQGRAFVWALIRRAGVFESPFHQHGGIQSHNIGRADVGRMVMGEVLRFAPEDYLLMETEARRIDALEDRAAEAAQVAPDEGEG